MAIAVAQCCHQEASILLSTNISAWLLSLWSQDGCSASLYHIYNARKKRERISKIFYWKCFAFSRMGGEKVSFLKIFTFLSLKSLTWVGSICFLGRSQTPGLMAHLGQSWPLFTMNFLDILSYSNYEKSKNKQCGSNTEILLGRDRGRGRWGGRDNMKNSHQKKMTKYFTLH